MKITSLSLFNLRSFEFAEFTFNPQFNLIAGINGAGKSTVLDAIRTCASHILPALRRGPSRPFGFGIDDIHDNAPIADATLHFTLDGEPSRFSLREWREPRAFDNAENLEKLRREILDADRLGDRPRNLIRDLAETLDTPSPTVFNPPEVQQKALAALEESAPLVLYFSTARTQLSARKESSSAAAQGAGAAYVRALGVRELSVVQLADWLRAQQALAPERQASQHLVDVVEAAVRQFLPGFQNLRPSKVGPSQLLIDHGGTTLHLRQLSDGERSVLVLMLDIAKRLTQANPYLADPLSAAEAVILIDEIDLHLHPQWQRKIVGDLTRTFPNCQFIATTHSPQVIGEVAHENIQMIDGDDVFVPPHSFGVDSSRVLEELMSTKPRNAGVEDKLTKIAKLIGEEKEAEARKAIATLAEEIGDSDPEIIRAKLLLDFLDEDGE
ncbi:MAG: ATP-binding protein [Alphaproteobacteria bacterium HGW-Alphaproteobacteria-7]|jgi:predicted ATPase|nr:MAG: ATP-binding protein [Alphaproteobacteria bacterium HGW-Alphaproteobacteria-7]